MCPLAAQPGRMPQVGYVFCIRGIFFRAPDVYSGSAAGQNATGWLRYFLVKWFFQGP
jgi:hypothetical protein